MRKPVYLGLFLTKESRKTLLQRIPPIHKNVKADHLTLTFKPTEEHVKLFTPLIGKTTVVTIIGLGYDEKAQAAVVDVDLTGVIFSNRVPHITVSHTDEVTSAYSNELLADSNRIWSGRTFRIEAVFDTYPRTI